MALLDGVNTAAFCEELRSSFIFHLDYLYYEDLVIWTVWSWELV